jgi:hypothetical protein
MRLTVRLTLRLTLKVTKFMVMKPTKNLVKMLTIFFMMRLISLRITIRSVLSPPLTLRALAHLHLHLVVLNPNLAPLDRSHLHALVPKPPLTRTLTHRRFPKPSLACTNFSTSRASPPPTKPRKLTANEVWLITQIALERVIGNKRRKGWRRSIIQTRC